MHLHTSVALLCLAACGVSQTAPSHAPAENDAAARPQTLPEASPGAPDLPGSVTLTYETPSGPQRLVARAPAHRKLAQADICSILETSGARPPAIVLADRSDGTYKLTTAAERSGGSLVLGCNERHPDGKGFLVPSITCTDGGPVCTFSLMSGGTSVPPYERTYWFDFDAAGRATLIAVAIPIL